MKRQKMALPCLEAHLGEAEMGGWLSRWKECCQQTPAPSTSSFSSAPKKEGRCVCVGGYVLVYMWVCVMV